MGALGHFIEREGVPTAQISLIREHTAAIRPPRALWVPFMLGRPFGAPNEPDFQRTVLRALLALFEWPSGPVLEDFFEEAPASHAGATAFASPVRFAQPEGGADGPGEAVRREIAQLAPWYEMARRRRGRTTVGVSGLAIEEAASHAVSYLGGSPRPPYADGISAGVALKRACDDLKAYYYEAVAARPGSLTAQVVDHWFWHETAAAKVFLALQQVCLNSPDTSLRPLGEIALVPQAIVHMRVEPHQAPRNLDAHAGRRAPALSSPSRSEASSRKERS